MKNRKLLLFATWLIVTVLLSVTAVVIYSAFDQLYADEFHINTVSIRYSDIISSVVVSLVFGIVSIFAVSIGIETILQRKKRKKRRGSKYD